RTFKRGEGGRTHITQIRLINKAPPALDSGSPSNKDPVARVRACRRIGWDDDLAITGALVVNVLVASRDHHEIRKPARPRAVEDFLAAHHSLEHWFVVFRGEQVQQSCPSFLDNAVV